MNTSIAALLDLQVIDKQRLTLRRGRDEKLKRLAEAEKAWAAGEATVQAAVAEVEKFGALTRQYQADVERCDVTINDLRARQPESKTNKDYMEIINGIEQAKLEKVKRESSIKELLAKVALQEERVAKARAQAEGLSTARAAAQAAAAGAELPCAEESALDAQYAERRAQVEPAFLEVYERLVKAMHKAPLLRVDPVTRATPLGAVLSFNQVEQIRMGKLVIDRTSNAILYLSEPARS
jgi:predicted  nucleic acid-binding Zn-ribbon protein